MFGSLHGRPAPYTPLTPCTTQRAIRPCKEGKRPNEGTMSLPLVFVAEVFGLLGLVEFVSLWLRDTGSQGSYVLGSRIRGLGFRI